MGFLFLPKNVTCPLHQIDNNHDNYNNKINGETFPCSGSCVHNTFHAFIQFPLLRASPVSFAWLCPLLIAHSSEILQPYFHCHYWRSPYTSLSNPVHWKSHSLVTFSIAGSGSLLKALCFFDSRTSSTMLLRLLLPLGAFPPCMISHFFQALIWRHAMTSALHTFLFTPFMKNLISNPVIDFFQKPLLALFCLLEM